MPEVIIETAFIVTLEADSWFVLLSKYPVKYHYVSVAELPVSLFDNAVFLQYV